MPPTVYLVSGANRGIGFALVQHLVVREDVIVFAGARDPSTATALNEIAGRELHKLHVVKLISADEANNRAAVDEIKRIAGRLDVVIANAGVGGDDTTVLEISLEIMKHDFIVNTLGPLVLLQATYPLLRASTSTAKFVPISSRSGSIAMGTQIPFPQAAYGTSKSGLNWIIKKLWTENPGLITFSICPGMVETDMSRAAIQVPEIQQMLNNMNVKVAQPEHAARLVLQQIDAATRETTDFIDENGNKLPW